jgi:hypothetical protein
MFGLYKRALDEGVGLTSLLVMILLDEAVYKAQRKGLIDFVKATPAKDAHELSLKVHNAMSDLAAKVAKSEIVLGAPGFLWKLKQGDSAKLK